MYYPTLPYGRQWVDEDDIEAVAKVLRGAFLTTGPAVEELERVVSEFCGVKHAVAVNSGTSALHCMYFAAGLSAGDEIITTPMTFAATANAALYLGASVKFVDVEPDTGNMDASLIEAAITDKTKLIVPIDFTGHPADYDTINTIANKHGITVVADAAHSFGAQYKGRQVGTLCSQTEISMHPVKPFTTGEGGMILTDDDDLAHRNRLFRTHGITRDPNALVNKDEGFWFYEQQFLGYNYRLTDIQGALGISQISKLGGFIDRRRQVVARYNEAFADLDAVMLPPQRDYAAPGWHLYVMRLKDKSRRRAFFDRLKQLHLNVQVHYIPVHWHPYYQGLGYQKGSHPVAEGYYESAISLPVYPKLTDDEIDSVIERVRMAVAELL
jgi:perosamine synthetase